MDIVVNNRDFNRLREIIDIHVPPSDQINIDGEVLLSLMSLYNINYVVRRFAHRVPGRTIVDTIVPLILTVNNNGSSCSICIEMFTKGDKVIRLPCGHLHHQTCLEEWVKYKPTCPICVADIELKSS